MNALNDRFRSAPDNSIPNSIRYEPILKPKICVVLTAYNDEEAVPTIVKDFKNQDNVEDIIVIDNNSTDNTAQIAVKSGARVVKEVKQGYGYACIRGLKEALSNDEANIIVLAEGDGTFTGRDLKKLIPWLDDVEMVLGSRTSYYLVNHDSQMDTFFVWGNLFLAKLLQIKHWNTRFVGKVRLTDVGCTYRAIRREALQKIIDKLYVGGNHFSPHMIDVALKNNLRVIEVPITFYKRIGKSKGASANKLKAVKIGLRMFWNIITYR